MILEEISSGKGGEGWLIELDVSKRSLRDLKAFLPGEAMLYMSIDITG
jgi:hypothetical protein